MNAGTSTTLHATHLRGADSADTGKGSVTSDDLTRWARDISQTTAIMRAVQVAVDAVDDGSIAYECAHVSRWSPAVGAARRRVSRVGGALMEKVCTLPVDWWTSLTLLEALDAALWHGSDLQGRGLQMDSSQVMSMAQAVIDELEELAQELASATGVSV